MLPPPLMLLPFTEFGLEDICYGGMKAALLPQKSTKELHRSSFLVISAKGRIVVASWVAAHRSSAPKQHGAVPTPLSAPGTVA